MSTELDYAPTPDHPTYRRGLNVCAILVMLSVFPLIWMGGLVTSHGAGMSVPDWPNSYGYNMFLFPPSEWIGGIFYEHTHRLLGTLSGFLSIALVLMAWGPARNKSTRYRIGVFAVAMLVLVITCVSAKLYLASTSQMSDDFKKSFSHFYVSFASLGMIAAVAWCCRRREPRRWLRWLTVVQLLAIIIQGTLGGLRVTEVNTELAIIHGCFAQAFFCLTAFTSLATSRWWHRAANLSLEPDSRSGRAAMWLAVTATVIVFAQLIAGATMRHKNAGLAIPDLPLAFGKVLPPLDDASLETANQVRIWTYHLPPATLGQVWLHFSHRLGAILVTLAIGLLAWQVFRKLGQRTAPKMVAGILCVLVTTQFTLGVLTVYLRKPADIASLHVAIGAVTLMTVSLAIGVLARQYARGKIGQPVKEESKDGVGRLATA